MLSRKQKVENYTNSHSGRNQVSDNKQNDEGTEKVRGKFWTMKRVKWQKLIRESRPGS